MAYKHNEPNQAKELLSGITERVTYHNSENGFCVLRVKVKGHKDLVTVTGNCPSISVGEYIKCSGIWHNDRNYGKQFKAHFLKSLPPNTLEGIEKYLGSGLIKGIGAHFAKKLVSAFGEQVFEIIESSPGRLQDLDGIGKFRAESISNNWQDQKIIREIMVFLQSHGVGTTRATRIYKTYGENAIEVVSNNPYKLAKDIRGIGFISADTIASNLGIDRNSLIRARAGVVHILFEATSEGHCGLPKIELIGKSCKLLEMEKSLIETAIDQEISSNSLILDIVNDKEIIFLSALYAYEQSIAEKLLLLSKSSVSWDKENICLEDVEEREKIKLAEHQRNAVITALSNKVTVITGGPGTGKTTIVKILLQTLKQQDIKIKLCAPTGRAAKRLSDATNMEATTIHRLLKIDPANGKFKHNDKLPISCEYLVIDEASMVDVPLFYALLKALPKNAALLIVGDVDQLPSVGAGQVLKDIIDSKMIATSRLEKIFRQAESSAIITNAHLVNNGILPDLRSNQNKNANSTNSVISDFYFIEAEPGDDIIDKIITIVRDRIPNRFKLNAVNDIQLLCPMQKGGSGARSLNTELQKSLNPNYTNGITKFGQIFAIGDKVMQVENNYDKEVYNGDIGIIKTINQEEQEIIIDFYDNKVTYDYTDLDQLTLAYATTIHKSQGSEYPAIVIPLTMQSYMMLKRNLIYTGITRGKKLVIVIGQKKALAIAVKNNNNQERYTKLFSCLVTYKSKQI